MDDENKDSAQGADGPAEKQEDLQKNAGRRMSAKRIRDQRIA